MLFLTYVKLNILCFGALSDDHAGVYFFSGADKKLSAVLGAKQAVRNGNAGFKRDQGALLAVLDIAAVSVIAVKDRIDDAVAFGIG